MEDTIINNANYAEVQQDNWKIYTDCQEGEGRSKQASILNKYFISTKVREYGSFRKSNEIFQITPQDLNFDPTPGNEETPTKFIPIEKEPGRWLAGSADWGHSTIQTYYKGQFFAVRFYPMMTNELVITENQLLTSMTPIREYMETLMKNDLLATEDAEYFEMLEKCLSFQATQGDPNIFESSNTFLKIEDIVDLGDMFIDEQNVMANIYMHEITFRSIMKNSHTDLGSRIMEKFFETGMVGQDTRYMNFMGHRFFLTNDSNLIPVKTVYATGSQKMLGWFGELQAPQVYIKWEKGKLKFYIRQILGRTIGNIRNVAKLLLT